MLISIRNKVFTDREKKVDFREKKVRKSILGVIQLSW
jgi:hypothetical protein